MLLKIMHLVKALKFWVFLTQNLNSKIFNLQLKRVKKLLNEMKKFEFGITFGFKIKKKQALFEETIVFN